MSSTIVNVHPFGSTGLLADSDAVVGIGRSDWDAGFAAGRAYGSCLSGLSGD
jgi:hypothetical protein